MPARPAEHEHGQHGRTRARDEEPGTTLMALPDPGTDGAPALQDSERLAKAGAGIVGMDDDPAGDLTAECGQTPGVDQDIHGPRQAGGDDRCIKEPTMRRDDEQGPAAGTSVSTVHPESIPPSQERRDEIAGRGAGAHGRSPSASTTALITSSRVRSVPSMTTESAACVKGDTARVESR